MSARQSAKTSLLAHAVDVAVRIVRCALARRRACCRKLAGEPPALPARAIHFLCTILSSVLMPLPRRGAIFISPLQGLIPFGIPFQGRCPWLLNDAPCGASSLSLRAPASFSAQNRCLSR